MESLGTAWSDAAVSNPQVGVEAVPWGLGLNTETFPCFAGYAIVAYSIITHEQRRYHEPQPIRNHKTISSRDPVPCYSESLHLSNLD